MQTKDLRIDNWINIYDDFNSQVTGFTNTGKVWFVKNPFDNECAWDIRKIKPIPLTEEWLINFGFEKKEANVRHGNGQDWNPEYPRTYQVDFVKENFVIRFEEFHYVSKQKIERDLSIRILLVDEWYEKIEEGNIDCIKMEYIHQIQNLYFALRGKELTL